MIKGKTSSKLGPDLDRDVSHFGMKVRYSRTQIKMSAERAGMLYAEALGRDKPYTARRWEQMELHNDFPKDQTRRWAIAKIVQMSLFFKLSTLGIDVSLPETKEVSSRPHAKTGFDISDYQLAFQQGWTQPFHGTLKEAEEEILDRMDTIYKKAPYLGDKQKIQAWRILCGFHILLATDIYGAQNNIQAMTRQTDMAVVLAKENKFPDLHAIALLQRGLFLKDSSRDFAAAIKNYEAALRIKNIPQQLRGKILTSMASAQTRLAQTQEDMSVALKNLDEAENLIGESTLEDFGFLVAFNEDKYRLSRGGALIGSPLKQLRSPKVALSFLPKVHRVEDIASKKEFSIIGHRQAHNHTLQAEIYIDQEQYSVAVALAEEALAYSVGLQSRVHLNKLIHVCNMLKESPYGKTIEVTMLEIGIMRNLRPELFN